MVRDEKTYKIIGAALEVQSAGYLSTILQRRINLPELWGRH